MKRLVPSSLLALSLSLLLLVRVVHLSHTQDRNLLPESLEPWFSDVIQNLTVVEGRPATLQCVVENLGHNKLAWIHKERHNLLTVQDSVITKNPRVSIRSDPPRRNWWLRIDSVRLEDHGHYMCQVNTAPMKSQTGHLQVVVPPNIDEDSTSSDVDIREGLNVKIRCKATGSPKPDIVWRREDERDIILSPSMRVPSFEGETLNLTRTTRLSMGPYLCIARNGVQPTVSKRIMVNVQFPPMVLIPSQLMGASIGEDATLICNLESNPRSITYWLLSQEILLISNNKYRISQEPDPSPRAFPYKIRLELKILDLRPQDFGSYTCVAKNPLGDTQGTIVLYEKPNPVTRAYVSEQDLDENVLQSHELIEGKPRENVKQDLISNTNSNSKEEGPKYSTGEALQRNKINENFMAKNYETSNSITYKFPILSLCCLIVGLHILLN